MSTSPSPPALVSPLALIGEPQRGHDPAETPDDLVEAVNAIARGEGLVAALDLADFILRTFFHGDPEAWREEGPGHAGFRAVLRHPALEPSPSTVWYALGVWEQFHAMPEGLANGLSLAHHRALLPVRRAGRKLALARAAVRYGWSKRRLEKEVRSEPDDVRKGRPRKPAFVRTAARVREALAEALAGTPTAEDVRRYGLRDTRRSMRTLREDLKALEALADSWESLVRDARDDS